MRYTQCRLSPFGELMLNDVKNLAETKPNYDNTDTEPIDLPSYFPNLLLNPSTGIAVGLATTFAPHYARDVYNAIIKIIDWKINGENMDLEEIINIIKAPDFPTKGQIINGESVKDIYRTGKGTAILRAKYSVEKNCIIYTEIPYKVAPSTIIQAIIGLNIADIKEVRDETSLKNGLRIIVELKKDANHEWIINKLFKETPLQSNYNVNMTAIVNNRPVPNLTIGQILVYYLQNLSKVHMKSINNRIENLNQKLFVTNTMIKAADYIEEIAKIIKEKDNPINAMIEEIGFSEKEATYVYNLKLSSLSKANKEDLINQRNILSKELEEKQKIKQDQTLFYKDLKKKLEDIRDSKIFKNDKRQTEILNLTSNSNLDMRDYVKNEPVIITYSTQGMIKAVRPDEFKTTRRNTMGVTNKTLREDEYICNTLTLNTHDNLLLFSDIGRCYLLPVFKVPISGRNNASKSINNFLSLSQDEKILNLVSVPHNAMDLSVVLTTKNGYIKRLKLEDIVKNRTSTVGTKAITLNDNDKICSVNICKQNDDIAIFTSLGRGLKFNIDDESKPLKMMGKTSKGLLAIKLKEKDNEVVVNASVLDQDHSIVIMTSYGFGKRLDSKTFKDQKRNQTPINYMSKIDKVGKIIGGAIMTSGDELLITTKQGQTLRCNIDNVKSAGRTTSGSRFINIKEDGDAVVSIAAISKAEEIEQ